MRTIHQMMPVDYAWIEREQGQTVVCKGGRFWRRVRPFFYRPLLVWEPITESHAAMPSTLLGGCQYLVADTQQSNSAMSFLMYDRVHEYSLAALDHNRRRLIKRALQNFTFKPIEDLKEFKDRGYLAYVDFYQRTKYQYKSERTRRTEFEKWAQTVFSFPKAILLGGYDANGLEAVSVSYWINDTLVYASLFSRAEALRKDVCEGMLHVVRQIACEQSAISQLLARPYNGGSSIDQYYLIRGCTIHKKPAILALNPLARTLLKTFLPKQYAKVCGS